MFKLSRRSLERLDGVHPALIFCVKYAIKVSKVDFGVTEGVRTLRRQKELLKAKKTQTLKSKHLTGHAVDLLAYLNGEACWELNLYDEIADAMREAAIKYKVKMVWGGSWYSVPDIRKWNGSMEEAHLKYLCDKMKQGKRPFIDAPHFQISK